MEKRSKVKKLILLLFEITANQDLNIFSSEGDFVYIMCAKDLNQPLLEGEKPINLQNCNLLRYYGTLKQSELDYQAFIVMTALSHCDNILLKNVYLYYNDSSLLSSIMKNLEKVFASKNLIPLSQAN